VAVLAGNLIYFSIERYLPMKAQHQLYQIDWGLAVDFWFCLVCYGLLWTAGSFRSRSRGQGAKGRG
jgi:hypothetical protein